MRKFQLLATLLLGGLMGTALVACEQKGPAEKAGEKIDDAAREVKQCAEKAADKVEDTAENLKDEAQGKN